MLPSMRRAVLVIGVIALTSACLSAPAFAQENEKDRAERAVDKCLEGHEFGPPPSCTFDGDGNLISRDYPGLGGDSGTAPGWFGPLIVIALLWGAIPTFVAANIAKERGQSVGAAAAAGFFGGWAGLAGVYFLMRPGVVDIPPVSGGGATGAISADPQAGPDVTAGMGAEPLADSIETRLAKLKDLRERDVIDESEYTERRREILDEI